MFADDTYVFSKVNDSSLSLFDLNHYLETINQWAHQWKKLFNPDPNKQATEVLFSRKVNSNDHPNNYYHGMEFLSLYLEVTRHVN